MATEQVRATTIEARALIGQWEGDCFVLLGAVDLDTYENESRTEWNDRWLRWAADAAGITDTKEVALSIEVPLDLFHPPRLSASTQPQSEGATHGRE